MANYINVIHLYFQSLVICLLVNSSQQQQDECGLLKNKVAAGEFPWMVKLAIQPSGIEESFYSCSGTLISNLHILTAAHCVHNETRLNDISNITLGIHSVSMQTVDWEKITIPAGFENVIENDIALITLSTPINLTEYVRPICLPLLKKIDDYANETVVLTEWGHNDSSKHSALYKSVTTVMACSLAKDSDMFICANPSIGYGKVGRGGPMNFYDKKLNKWFILGVAGKGDAASKDNQSGMPILFTSVTSQLEFIRKHSGVTIFDINQPTKTTINKPINQTTKTTTETTTQEVLRTTKEPHTFSCIGKSDGNHPNSVSNCSAKFYMCSNQSAFPFYCASGLVYRSDSKTCDWPNNVAECSSQNTFS